VQVTTPDLSLVGGHAWPEFLPDGRHFLYTNLIPGDHGIYAGDLDDRRFRKHLVKVFSSASYSSGYLLYARDDLIAQRFDPERLETTSAPLAIAPPVYVDYNLTHKAYFSVAASGELAARHGVDPAMGLAWFDRSGQLLGTLGDPGLSYSNPTISPDGTRAVATASDPRGAGPANLWLFNLSTGDGTRMTFGRTIDYAPLWSPTADRILFASIRGGRGGLYEQNTISGAERPLPSPAPTVLWQALEAWTAAADYVTFSAMDRKTRADVWAMPLSGERRPVPILRNSWNEGQSQIAPDGRLLAYASDETGMFQVYVQTFPEGNAKWQLSTAGGYDPRWSRDGRELFYIAADRSLMAVDVTTGARFGHGSPRKLFETRLRGLWQDTRNHYDVTPDGRRFLLLAPDADPHAIPYTITVNWARR
jgi:hypothetical protein